MKYASHSVFALALSFFVPSELLAQSMLGDAADGFTAGAITGVQDGNGLNPAPSGGNTAGHTLKIGSVSVNADGGRAPILIFQLPDLGAVANPFTTASLTVGVGAIDNASEINVDLYGLTRRTAEPTIDFADDYYLGPNDTTNAVKLQDDFLKPDTPDGTNNAPVPGATDATGNAALLAFLNSQYETGVGANQYVYLRLNVDGDMLENGATAVTGYNITTANDDVIELRPKIDYTTSIVLEDADFDADGDIDGADFLAWQQSIDKTSGATLAQGDADGDGAVDMDDLTIWSNQFGAAAAAARQAPEPAALAIAAIGLTALALGRRVIPNGRD